MAEWPSTAFAYRPFDSTDPVVADPGEFEVEVSPVSFRHEDAGHTWIAPQLRLNYGFAEDWEVVLEGQWEFPQRSRDVLVENALSFKYVMQQGSLQEKPGPSIATEIGLLLPGINDEAGFGGSLAGIIGEKWDWGALHFNIAGSLTREKRGEIFLGTIIEGPDRWTVRPVGEFVYLREAGLKEEIAILGGFIWQIKDKLAFDFAVRQASVNSEPETEIRIGLTFAFTAR
jgi:hypothetical protein